MADHEDEKMHVFFGVTDLGKFRIGAEPSTHRFFLLPAQLPDGSMLWAEQVDGDLKLVSLKPATESETQECRRLYDAAVHAQSTQSDLSVSKFEIDEILSQLPASAVDAVKAGEQVTAMKSLILEGGFRVEQADDLANQLVEYFTANSD